MTTIADTKNRAIQAELRQEYAAYIDQLKTGKTALTYMEWLRDTYVIPTTLMQSLRARMRRGETSP